MHLKPTISLQKQQTYKTPSNNNGLTDTAITQ